MIVIRFRGGLGNQMFQYAFCEKMRESGRKVVTDLDFYECKDVMPFVLKEVFPNVRIDVEQSAKKNKKKSFFEKIKQRLMLVQELEDGIFVPAYLKRKNGIFEGYWQTEKYWLDIKETILEKFEFAQINDEKVLALSEYLKSNNTVSIHIRRGDYTIGHNNDLFGGICTDTYYKRCIEHFVHKMDDIKFVVFSNDEEWVKSNLVFPNAIFVSDCIGEGHPDWYSLFLMSCCKHNIIANSSFSWWAAYLNKNTDKIVVAPKKWINGQSTKDIWPMGWIKLSGDE